MDSGWLSKGKCDVMWSFFYWRLSVVERMSDCMRHDSFQEVVLFLSMPSDVYSCLFGGIASCKKALIRCHGFGSVAKISVSLQYIII